MQLGTVTWWGGVGDVKLRGAGGGRDGQGRKRLSRASFNAAGCTGGCMGREARPHVWGEGVGETMGLLHRYICAVLLQKNLLVHMPLCLGVHGPRSMGPWATLCGR